MTVILNIFGHTIVNQLYVFIVFLLVPRWFMF